MPLNKNAITRYKILDDLLSNRYHNYTLDDLTEEVSVCLAEYDPNTDGVVRRTIEKDIKFLEDVFDADIERYSVGYTRKKCLRYADPSFSIFKKEMSQEERYLLREALSFLGQFDNLPNLDGLEKLRLGLLDNIKDEKPVVSFTTNPIENTNLFGELFTAITQRQVIELHYHKFSSPETDQTYNLYPYLLREYYGRWYLFAVKVENNKLKCFPLDRMDKVVRQPAIEYKDYDGDLYEIFEEIIGVGYYEEEAVNNIVFWVSNQSKDFVATKPLHDSQRTISKKDTEVLREKYPHLEGGRFFRIECKKNYELIRELCSFGKELIVLEPAYIQDEIWNQIHGMNEEYLKLRTNRS